MENSLNAFLNIRADEVLQLITWQEVTKIAFFFGKSEADLARYLSAKANYVYSQKYFFEHHRNLPNKKQINNDLENFNKAGISSALLKKAIGHFEKSNKSIPVSSILDILLNTKIWLLAKNGAKRYNFENGVSYVQHNRHYTIGENRLKEIFSSKELLNEISDINSNFYSKRIRKIISKEIQDRQYTKSTKDIKMEQKEQNEPTFVKPMRTRIDKRTKAYKRSQDISDIPEEALTEAPIENTPKEKTSPKGLQKNSEAPRKNSIEANINQLYLNKSISKYTYRILSDVFGFEESLPENGVTYDNPTMQGFLWRFVSKCIKDENRQRVILGDHPALRTWKKYSEVYDDKITAQYGI